MKKKNIPYSETIQSLKNLATIEKKTNFSFFNLFCLSCLFTSFILFIYWLQLTYYLNPCLKGTNKLKLEYINLRINISDCVNKIKDQNLFSLKNFR